MPDKTYILDLVGGGQRRITVPEEYTVTFGPLVPGVRSEKHRAGVAALRVYADSAKKAAVACFVDVIAFRDQTLKIEEKIIKKERKTLHEDGKEGGRAYVVEARIEEWADPDCPKAGGSGVKAIATDEWPAPSDGSFEEQASRNRTFGRDPEELF